MLNMPDKSQRGQGGIYERIGLDWWPNVFCLQKHIARYNFALPYCEGLNVADVGSGLGWGSFLLSNVAKKVTGFELAEDAFSYAECEYKLSVDLDLIEFVNADWMSVDLPGEFDTIVAFEVFEHIEAPMADIIAHTFRMLRESDSSTLIASLPVNQGQNQFHVAGDMSYQDCRRAFVEGADWGWYDFYYQRTESKVSSQDNTNIFLDFKDLGDDDTRVEEYGVDSGFVIFVGGR